ncbi:uncharacterized protein LOC131183127 [Hevea brasiliensis]|uniref:uncharacterized protein LOC131183127 n=1 Tax=Hevea brasiliensis TaxID=3981 RepID=UPI0025E4B662|nr:uncharacterized protein LOC131183127 [Hevea brasiliensis]
MHFAGYAALLFLVLIYQGCYARTSKNCTTSCGNIDNIRYPFRFKNDPENCGHKESELALGDAGFQKDNCSSIPRHYLNVFDNESWASPYKWDLLRQALHYEEKYYQSLMFINCKDPVPISPLYVDASSCINNSGYWYVKVGYTNVTDLVDSCRIEQMVVASLMPKEVKNISYMDLHRIMSYGFELSWAFACCFNYQENRCNLQDARAINGFCTQFITLLYNLRHVRPYGKKHSTFLSSGRNEMG